MLSIILLIADEGMRKNTRQLRKNRMEIVELLSVTANLITELNAAECISDRQQKHLSALPLSRRGLKLLNMMLLKNVHEYNTCIDVLRRTGRADIALLLGIYFSIVFN